MRITLDKNKIKENFKIVPIHYKNWQAIKSKYDIIIDNRINGHDKMNQFEERIVLKPSKYYQKYLKKYLNYYYLPVKYITQIDIINPRGVLPISMSYISNIPNPFNIKINIINKYQPTDKYEKFTKLNIIHENVDEMVAIPTDLKNIFEKRDDRIWLIEKRIK